LKRWFYPHIKKLKARRPYSAREREEKEGTKMKSKKRLIFKELYAGYLKKWGEERRNGDK